LLYTDYIYPLEIAGVILLVAMVAAIALTLRRRKDAKGQTPGLQVRVKASDRLRIVQLDPVSQRRAGAAGVSAGAPGGPGQVGAAGASDPTSSAQPSAAK